jgi:hypothetical protein
MNPTARWRAAMNLALFDDAQREATFAGIEKVAQSSALIQNPTIAASYAALTIKGNAFAVSVGNASALESQFKASCSTRDLSRDTFDRELSNYRTLVENNATSAADITGMGLTLLTVNKASTLLPSPPAALLVIPGKVHGKARVLVQGKGYLGHFAAQMSPDPIGAGTWSTLPGSGKERKLSGYASGTRVWVQFATVVRGIQSAWCTPVLVILP